MFSNSSQTKRLVPSLRVGLLQGAFFCLIPDLREMTLSGFWMAPGKISEEK
jgi:hypothetical protein